MSTHGCFLPPFSLFPSYLVVATRCWSPGANATVDDDSYYTGGAYYYVMPTDNDQE